MRASRSFSPFLDQEGFGNIPKSRWHLEVNDAIPVPGTDDLIVVGLISHPADDDPEPINASGAGFADLFAGEHHSIGLRHDALIARVSPDIEKGQYLIESECRYDLGNFSSSGYSTTDLAGFDRAVTAIFSGGNLFVLVESGERPSSPTGDAGDIMRMNLLCFEGADLSSTPHEWAFDLNGENPSTPVGLAANSTHVFAFGSFVPSGRSDRDMIAVKVPNDWDGTPPQTSGDSDHIISYHGDAGYDEVPVKGMVHYTFDSDPSGDPCDDIPVGVWVDGDDVFMGLTGRAVNGDDADFVLVGRDQSNTSSQFTTGGAQIFDSGGEDEAASMLVVVGLILIGGTSDQDVAVALGPASDEDYPAPGSLTKLLLNDSGNIVAVGESEATYQSVTYDSILVVRYSIFDVHAAQAQSMGPLRKNGKPHETKT